MVKIKSVTTKGIIFSYFNEYEFNIMYNDIFNKLIYDVKLDNDSPFIIDCGSNIGVSILYFKSKYPKSKVIAFEPNPETFELLNKNINNNKLDKLKIVNSALGASKGTVVFYVGNFKKGNWATTDSVFESESNDRKKITVKCIKLSTYITKQVDLIKIDIEGLETEVIFEISKKMDFVKNLVFEFHGITGDLRSDFSKLDELFSLKDFKYTIREEGDYNNTKRAIVYAKNSKYY